MTGPAKPSSLRDAAFGAQAFGVPASAGSDTVGAPEGGTPNRAAKKQNLTGLKFNEVSYGD